MPQVTVVRLGAMLAALSFLATSMPAEAGKADTKERLYPCKVNRQEFCPDSPIGKAAPCLRKHMSQLTLACRTKIEGIPPKGR